MSVILKCVSDRSRGLLGCDAV